MPGVRNCQYLLLLQCTKGYYRVLLRNSLTRELDSSSRHRGQKLQALATIHDL
jgi:hypothetical protein